MKKSKIKALLIAVVGLSSSVLVQGAAVTLINDDVLNYASFTTGTTNWSSGAVPTAGNTYDTTTHGMRSPTGAGATFAGDSLTLSTPSNSGGYSFAYKVNASATLSANWILNGGVIVHNNASTQVGTFAGTMNVGDAGGTINAKQGPFIISANLTGTGNLTLITAGTGFSNTLSGNNTAFTGKLIWSGSPAPSVTFASTNAMPGNPSAPTPDQITLAGTLLDAAGIQLTNSNGGITLTGNSTINASAPTGAVTVISEPITGGGNLIKRGSGILTLSGDNTFSGGLNLFGVTVGGQLNLNSPTAWGTGPFIINNGNNGLIDNTSGGLITLANGNSQTWQNDFTFIGSSSLDMGPGFVIMSGANVAVTVSNSTLSVGEVFDDGLFRTLTKNGSGTLVLNGGGGYSGNTVVNGGRFVIGGSGSLGSSPVVMVASNATLDLSGVGGFTFNFGQTLTSGGSLIGNVSDGSGSTVINPGSNPGAGTFTLGGSLNLNGGGTLNFDVADVNTIGGGVNDLIVVSNQLNIAGPTTLNMIGVPSVGVYTLIQYGSFAGSLANISVPPGFIITNNTTSKAIEVIVTHAPAALTWKGDGSANIWDIGTAANWLQSGTNQVFFSGDNVTFDNSGSASPAINLAVNVSPTTVTVNSSQNYDFTSAGILTGNLTKSGTGTLILENSNSYGGLTLINGGTLQVGNGGFTGNMGVGPVTNNAALVFNLGAIETVNNPIGGSGSLAQSGSSDVTLTASNTYSGPTVLNSGRLLISNGSALGATNSGTTVNAGTQLYIVANVNMAEPFSINGIGTDGNGALRKGGGGVSTNSGAVTLTADSTIGLDGGATLALNSPITGAFALAKNGPGTLALNSSNSYTGTVISSGVINLGNNKALGAGPVTADSSGRFVLADGLNITNSFAATAPAPGLRLVFLMVNDNTNGIVTTVSGPLSFGTSPINGGNFVGPNSSGYLNISGTITNPAGTFVSVRSGNVRFSGGGDYQQFQIRANTTSIGANNGLATNAVVDIGANGSTTAPTLLDLNGYDQILAGLATAITPANLGWVTNGGATPSTLTLDLGDGNVQSFGGGIVGNLSLVLKSGIQSLGTNGSPLSGLYLYTGNTRINGGTLFIGNTIAWTNTPLITITNGAVLDVTTAGITLSPTQVLAGNGTVNGNVTGSGVSPGNSTGQIGQLTVNGDIALNGVTTFQVNKTANTNDLLVVSGTVTYGGTLAASNLGGSLNIGDNFTVVSAGVHAGGFSSISGSPGAGQAWSFTNGVLSVVAGSANNPTNITFSVSGNTLNLSWPADHLGWYMQSNSVDLASSANWFDIPGSQSVTNLGITLNPALPKVFFRMRSP